MNPTHHAEDTRQLVDKYLAAYVAKLTTRSDRTVADVLHRAAEHIYRHGWHQGALYACGSQATCATGAIAIAAYGEPVEFPTQHQGPGAVEFDAAMTWLGDYLHAHNPHADWQVEGVYEWNDDHRMTGQNVIDTLHAAADAWDAEHPAGDLS